MERAAASPSPSTVASGAAVGVLSALTLSHLLNDMMQSVVMAIYPLLKESFGLTFAQIGLITLVNQVTASLLQPVVGLYTDRRPLSYALSIGMGFTFVGVLLLAYAPSLPLLLVAAAFVGIGSSVFHPEASRIARLASGGRHGFAQSVFQVGGNLGSALGPLLAALVVVARGQTSIAWFSLAAVLAMGVLAWVGGWYSRHRAEAGRRPAPVTDAAPALPTRTVVIVLAILGLLVFSKYAYLAGLTNFYTFYLMERFQVEAKTSQLLLFVLMFAVAAGTIIGGPVGDRIGRKAVIRVSILGVAPFTVLLPYADLPWTVALSVVIGFTLASAFSAILVYAQELMPGRVGMVSGMFFGFAFGVAGICAALIGRLADAAGIEHVFRVCSFLPLIGILALFLPDVGRKRG